MMRAWTRAAVRPALVGAAVTFVFVACSSQDDSSSGAPPNEPVQNAPGCGRLTTPCDTGGACDGAPDCKSGNCHDGKCADVVPPDGTQNNGETDVDCGGPSAAACADGKKCSVASDCVSGVCTGGICQAPSHTDGIKNGDETGVDCGGPTAPKCPAGQGCVTSTDCAAAACVNNLCAGPSHTDKIKNGDETGVDCGGPTAPKCPPGQGCVTDADCDNTRCNPTTKVCDPPTGTDGLKNGTETDVDCGGGAPTNARRCKDGNKPSTSETCAVDGDCASGFCAWDKKCVTARSCKGAVANATAGITSCGRYESDNALAATEHEYCCRTLPLPTTTTVRLDKYEVTAGRLRQFVESIPNYNIRQWAKDEIAGNTKAGKTLASDLTPTMVDLLPASSTPGDALNIVMQIGATVMATNEPSMEQGCWVDKTAYGANTYYWDLSVLKAHFGTAAVARKFTQAQYDEKSINCAPYWIYAAFCAWDGGRLPTADEMYDAYGTAYYPWNSSTFGFTFPLGAAQTYEDVPANYFNNTLAFYGYPQFGDAWDVSGYIAAPGRFIKDKTFKTSANGESWMDLGANMMEVTHYNTAPGLQTATCAPGPPGGGVCQQGGATFCDYSLGGNGGGGCPNGSTLRATNMPTSIWVGGSWEGHYQFGLTNGTSLGLKNNVPEPYFTRNSYNLRVHTQYGKTGVRCARWKTNEVTWPMAGRRDT